jgi:prepilin-type N-terminal cleavage/methylation domain-containing protein
MKNLTQNRAGFTLIELLVAMVITTIIVTVLVYITSIAVDTWNRSRSELRAARQAKAMVDSMVNDFESLVVRGGNDFEWLHARTEPPQNSSNAATLIFFSAATDRYDGKIGTPQDDGGDVSCVGYKLDWRDPIASGAGGSFQTFVLNRLLVDPKQAFDQLLGKQDLNSAFTSFATELTNPENFVCENVFQFTITFNLEVPSTSTPPGPPELEQVVIQPSGGVQRFRILGTGITTDPANATLQGAKLKSVGISITVLSDSGVDLLRKSPAQANSPAWLAKNSYEYSKLVQLPSM